MRRLTCGRRIVSPATPEGSALKVTVSPEVAVALNVSGVGVNGTSASAANASFSAGELEVTGDLRTGVAQGVWCPNGMAAELPGDQRVDDERSLVFDSGPDVVHSVGVVSGVECMITASEASELRNVERFLQHLRIRLHYLTGRAEDRLLFDHQEKIARALDIDSTATRRASEVLMQRYYVTAKMVMQLNTVLLQNYGSVIFPDRGAAIVINARFQVVRELLDIRDEDVFERHPAALLECFLLLQQRSELKGMTARTLRALWHGRKLIDADFRRDPANRALVEKDGRYTLARPLSEVAIPATLRDSLVARQIGAYGRTLCASPVYLAAHGMPTQLDDLHRHYENGLGGFMGDLIGSLQATRAVASMIVRHAFAGGNAIWLAA